MKNILTDLKTNHNVVFLCRNTDPLKFTSELLKSVPKKSKILYVSVNKPCKILIEKLKKDDIDFSNWSFIDCISSSMLIAETPSKQCVHLSSPKAIVDLSLAIDDRMAKSNLIIFDSVSSLLSYNDYVPVLQFLNTLMANVRKTKTKVAYLLSYDAKKEVMEDLALFADKVAII